jgi:hypothetical protein
MGWGYNSNCRMLQALGPEFKNQYLKKNLHRDILLHYMMIAAVGAISCIFLLYSQGWWLKICYF